MTDQLSEQQISEFKQAFAFFDKDGDGTITVKELETVMKSVGLNPTETELLDMINEVDSDGDASVDLDEFLIMMAKQMKQADDDIKLRQAFQIFDTNADGYITKVELRQVLINVGEEMSEKEVEEMITGADLDGDGKVNYQEFVKILS